MAAIRLEAVRRRFAGAPRPAVHDVTLTVPAGSRHVLVGPSGAGKTTLLRMIAGLEPLDHGDISIADASVASIPPHRRGVGFLFQQPALLPHLTVARNLEQGIRRGRRTAERTAIRDLAGELGILDLLDRRPGALSGGQRQRVALGRVLAARPQALLLDEPTANLDPPLRRDVLELIDQTARRRVMTVLMVTHEIQEALGFAETITVLGPHGTVLQSAPPAELISRPAHREVARWLGPERWTLLSLGADTSEQSTRGASVEAPPFAVPTLSIRAEPMSRTAGPEPPAGSRPEGFDLVGTLRRSVEVAPGRWSWHMQISDTVVSLDSDRPWPADADRARVRVPHDAARPVDPESGLILAPGSPHPSIAETYTTDERPR